MIYSWQWCQCNFVVPVLAPGGHSNILVYTCLNKKTGEKESFFAVECEKRGMCFMGLKCQFSGKRGGFVEIISNSWDSNPFRGKFEAKFLFGGNFCFMTKMCAVVYFKTTVQCSNNVKVYDCISKWAPLPVHLFCTPFVYVWVLIERLVK